MSTILHDLGFKAGQPVDLKTSVRALCQVVRVSFSRALMHIESKVFALTPERVLPVSPVYTESRGVLQERKCFSYAEKFYVEKSVSETAGVSSDFSGWTLTKHLTYCLLAPINFRLRQFPAMRPWVGWHVVLKA